MNNIVITKAKNEDGFIDNFIEHYFNLGFRFILILLETDQIYTPQLDNVLTFKHSKKGDEINLYIPNILKKINIHIDWVLHVDIDEYLFLKDNMKINDYINKFKKDNIDQFMFKWGMIENFCSINTENNFQNMLYNNKIYSSGSYKTMYKLDAITKVFMCPHFVYVNNDTYLDDLKVPVDFFESKEKKYYENAILIHFHTRCLENVFVKALTYSYNDKKINSDIFNTKISLDELFDKMLKLRLPFEHSNNEVLELGEYPDTIIETNTIVDIDIINNKLIETCNNLNIDINIINDYINELESTHYQHFIKN